MNYRLSCHENHHRLSFHLLNHHHLSFRCFYLEQNNFRLLKILYLDLAMSKILHCFRLYLLVANKMVCYLEQIYLDLRLVCLESYRCS
jgi:hypothetical protein